MTKLVYILKLVPTGLGVKLDVGEKERAIKDGPEGFSLSRWLCHLLRWKRLEEIDLRSSSSREFFLFF